MKCHSEAINLEFNKPYELKDLIETLEKSPGIIVKNNHENLEYPLATDAINLDEVFVGRIRRDDSLDSGVNLWVVADNIRKGAASNAVQIAELMINQNA